MSSKIETLIQNYERMITEDPMRFDSLPGVTVNWTSGKLVQLFKMLQENAALEAEGYSPSEIADMEEGHTHQDMATILGFERSTVTKKIRSVDWNEFETKLNNLSNMSHEEYITDVSRQFRTESLAKFAMKRRRREISIMAQLKHMEESLKNNAGIIKVAQLPPIRRGGKTKSKRKRKPEHMVLLLSDLHVGQEFDLEETGGLSQYNVNIFKQRAANLREAVLDIHELHSEMRSLPELHILALGDNVNGANAAGNWGCAYNSSLSVFDQAQVGSSVIVQMIQAWAPYFNKINFHGVVGNHGRINMIKGTDKLQANFDNVMYAMIQGSLNQLNNVDVHFSKTWWRRVDVQGTGIVMVHGDCLKKSINTILKKEQQVQSLLMSKGEKPFDIFVAGHFHSFQEAETTNGRIILNGSFVGGDVYSMNNLGIRSKPSQTLFGVHPDHGITWDYKLDLDHRRISYK